MTQKEHIDYWISSARHDYDTMESLYQNEKYDWALFLGHLVLEKLLKALFVKNSENSIPPKLHNLVRLAEAAQLNLDEERKLVLD